jgi:hypothetical protein
MLRSSFTAEEKEESLLSEEMVRMRDPETDTVVTVPKRELRPGMIRARFIENNGRPGELVWVDPATLNADLEPKHPPFSADVHEILEEIRTALHDVYPMTPEEWEYGFRCDTHPTGEIRAWLHAARVYKHFTDGWDCDADQKAHMFMVLKECLTNGRNHLLLREGPRTLSRKRVRAITEYYFAQKLPSVPWVKTDPDYHWQVEVRQQVEQAKVIVAADSNSNEKLLVFGRAEYDAAVKSGSEAIGALVIKVDPDTDDIEKLVAIVRVVKGRDDFTT